MAKATGFGAKGPAKTAAKPSAAANAATALDRLSSIEKYLGEFGPGISKAFQQIQKDMELYSSTLEALVSLAGEEKVEAEIKRLGEVAAAKEIVEAQAKADKTKANLLEAVKRGEMVVSGMATSDSLIAGTQVDKDGKPVAPGFFQNYVKDIDEALRTQFLGQTAGTVIDLGARGKATISAVYERNPEYVAPKPEPVAASA